MRRENSPIRWSAVLSWCLLILLYTGPASGAERPAREQGYLSGIIHTTPTGTVLRYGEDVILLPGVRLSKQVLRVLQQAAATVVTRRIAHLLLTLAIGHSDKFLGRKGYDMLTAAYQNGTLLMPVNLWHYAVRLSHMWSGWKRLFYETELRLGNLGGLKRRGRMPVYTGPQLEQAVFIDAVLDDSYETGQTLELLPLQTVDPNTLSSPWQKAVAGLVNTALEQGVDLIRLSPEEEESVIDWHSTDGQWRKSTLYQQGDIPEQGRYLLAELVDSYRTPLATGLVSVFEPAGLVCAAQRLAGSNDSCRPLGGLEKRWSVSGDLLAGYHEQTAAGFLHIHASSSWSPGLPGVMTLAEDSTAGLQLISGSRQYRMPEWTAIALEALLYELAVTLAENTLGAALEKLNNWWHGAGHYQVIKFLKTGLEFEGEPSAQVVLIRDRNGTHWIKKSAQWYQEGGHTPANALFLSLARERQILNELNHPNIVKVHDSWLENAGTPNARLVLIEEYGGQSAAQLYPTTMGEFKHLMKSTLTALDVAHQKGIGHFDIKPNNILVGNDGQIKLADFGEAVHLNAQGQGVVDNTTPGFMAPETETRVSEMPWQADIWGLGTTGVMLARALGIPAFDQTSLDLVKANIDREVFTYENYVTPADDPPDGPGLTSFLGQMLRFDYWRRGTFKSLLQHPFLKASDDRSKTVPLYRFQGFR